MEVSGKRLQEKRKKRANSPSRCSNEDCLLFCMSCDRDGEHVSAKGYCTTCNEHLCETCYMHHNKPAHSRHHVLLDKVSMPTTPYFLNAQDDFDSCGDHEDETLKFYCTEHDYFLNAQDDFDSCGDHEDETLKFYCTEHDIVVCSICVTLDHRLCKVQYIPKLSKHILEGEELRDLLAEIKTLEKVCKSDIKKAEKGVKAISQNHDEIIKSLHKFRKEIKTYLDEMEKRLVKEAEILFNKQQMALKKLSKDVSNTKEEITKIK